MSLIYQTSAYADPEIGDNGLPPNSSDANTITVKVTNLQGVPTPFWITIEGDPAVYTSYNVPQEDAYGLLRTYPLPNIPANIADYTNVYFWDADPTGTWTGNYDGSGGSGSSGETCNCPTVAEIVAGIETALGSPLANLYSAAANANGAAQGALSQITLLMASLTTTRISYLDKLNVPGLVAAQADVTAIQNNTDVAVTIPTIIERSTTATVPFLVEILCYDENGAMAAPTSTPTITVANMSGMDRSANLGAVSSVSTGRYRATYTIPANAPVEELVFTFSVVRAAGTRVYSRAMIVADAITVDFTAADRSALTAIQSKTEALPAAYPVVDGQGAVTLAGDSQAALVQALANGAFFRAVHAYTAGNYSVDQQNRIITFYDTDGTTVLMTHAFSEDGAGRITSRSVS